MGFDTDNLKIIGMNATGRKGRPYNDFRKANLSDVVKDERPDIMFLPGDQPDIFTETSYKQLLDPTYNETVLLYDSTRLKANHQSQFKIPNYEFGNVLAPLVDINSPAPAQSIVKQFICVSWHCQFTETERGSKVLYEIGKSIMMLAQFLAWNTGTEILIGGDFNLPQDVIGTLIKEHNRMVQDGIDSIKPLFQMLGYMDCMTDNIHGPVRRLRQLQIHSCKRVEKMKDTSFFVASKEMQLRETKHVKRESLYYRSTQLQFQTSPRTDYCPEPTYTKTNMYIPPRPPKHHGG